MKLHFEYGQGLMGTELPDTTDVYIPGETVPDPERIPEEELESTTRESILNPIGLKPISKQVSEGSKVVIIFPDKVKGGLHNTAHRRISIPIILEECLKAGVRKSDITLLCSNGLHRKMNRDELKMILGEKIFNEYWYTKQIINHDSEDWDNLVDLGLNGSGDHIIMNRKVYESDLAVMIGHTLGNPYGGYSGGYKHSATGITHWKCIGAHHVPHVMHRDDFTPVTKTSMMRQKFDQISQYMEEKMGKKFFICDAVLDTYQRQIAVFTGFGELIQPLSWKVADKRTFVPWANKKYDVVVFGMPQNFHYGNGHGTNPILMLQAISANIIRHKRILKDNCVVIVSSICNGYFHDEVFPSYRPLYEMYQRDYNYTLPDVEKYDEYFSTRKDFIDKYRYNYGYHPYHAFSMVSCGHIAHMNTSAIYIVGAYEPGYARGMDMKTAATFEDALLDARKYVGEKPNILALPKTFKTAGVHLMMHDDSV